MGIYGYEFHIRGENISHRDGGLKAPSRTSAIRQIKKIESDYGVEPKDIIVERVVDTSRIKKR